MTSPYNLGLAKTNDIEQIINLLEQNLRNNLSEEKKMQGFLTWVYSYELLLKLHQQAPSVVVKQDEIVVGYALTVLRQSKSFYDNINTMVKNVEHLKYADKIIGDYKYYIMGQICVDENHRGSGIFQLLYDGHKKYYQQQFELLVTEISTSNHRSIKAHSNYGFQTINTYKDNLDEWNVVVLPL